MALKPTIYKAQVELADSDRHVYDGLALTIAQHPSETLERTTARLIAFLLNSADGLTFTKGLSTADEPDLWLHSDSGEIEQWIEVGQPEEPRLRKASGRAARVKVYAFGRSASTWWKLNGDAISALDKVEVVQFDWDGIGEASKLLQRHSKLNASIVGGVVYLSDDNHSVTLEPAALKTLG